MPLKSGLAALYSFFVNRKNKAFDEGKEELVRLSCPVISVGNISVGGTGKTPVVHFMAQYFSQQNIKVAIVSRAYKAESSTPVRVDLEKASPLFFGDEPSLLSALNPRAAVFVGKEKNQIAKWAESEFHPQVLIVDDGFQHRRLYRNMDIVLLDATESIDKAYVLPKGNFREDLSSLHRAHMILLTKYNLATEEQKKFWESQLSNFTYYRLNYETRRLSGLSDFNESLNLPSGLKTLCLLSGLAKNASFKKSFLREYSAVQVLKHFEYADHAQYDSEQIRRVWEESRQLGAQALVMTAKDAVKVRALGSWDFPIYVLHVDLKFYANQEEDFYAEMARLFI